MSFLRAAIFLVLPGCGLVVGLRSDYANGEAGASDASGGGEGGGNEGGGPDGAPNDTGAADSPQDSTSTWDGNPCSDMQQDGQETDVDCGGGTCAPCANGKRCAMNSDCQSNDCKQSNHRCQ